MSQASPPEPLQRNGFDRWLWERNIDNIEAGRRLSRHPVTIGRYRLPFGDPKRRIPEQEVLDKIHAWSGGEVTIADFYPPHLSRRIAAAAESEPA